MARLLSHLAAPAYEIRLTIPAREALERRGNSIDRPPSSPGTPIVILRHPPRHMCVVQTAEGLAGRMPEEPPWPGERDADVWDRRAWVPCPQRGCGAALLWCEAGYVPGWRICLAGHASQFGADSLAAKRQRQHDASTLHTTRLIAGCDD